MAAGALMGRAVFSDREEPLAALGAAVVRLLVPALIVLTLVTVGVQRWFEVSRWEDVLGEVRRAVLGVINLGPVESGSPVAWFWLVALLVQSFVVVLVLRRVPVRAAVAVIAVLTAASFVGWSVVEANAHGPARFWPVGIGVLFSFAVARRPVPPWPAALLVGLTGLGVGVFAILGSTGRITVLSGVVAGGLLVALGGARWSPEMAFGSRLTGLLAWVAWVGFCAAWPALRLAEEAAGRSFGLRDRAELLVIVLVASCAIIAVLAGVLVVLRGGVWRSGLALAAAAAALLVAVPGTNRVEAIESDIARVEAVLDDGVPACSGAESMPAGTCDNPQLEGTINLEPDAIRTDFQGFLDCWSMPYDTELNVCDLGGAPGVPRILVVGDSHARVLLGAFQRLADHRIVSVSATAKASCAWSTLPIRAKDPLRSPRCEQWRAKLADWLDEHAQEFDVVVTTAYNGRMVGPRAGRVQGLVDAWTPVAEGGTPIVALRDNPQLPGDPNDCLEEVEGGNWADCDVPVEVALDEFDPFGRAAELVDGAHHVDVTPFFCDTERCPLVIGGVGVYRDHNHVSASYAETLALNLYRAIARTGVLTDDQRSAAAAALRMTH